MCQHIAFWFLPFSVCVVTECSLGMFNLYFDVEISAVWLVNKFLKFLQRWLEVQQLVSLLVPEEWIPRR